MHLTSLPVRLHDVSIDFGGSVYLMNAEGRMVHQTISQADATISSLLDALQGLEGELDRAITLNVAIVSSETRDNIDRLRKTE